VTIRAQLYALFDYVKCHVTQHWPINRARLFVIDYDNKICKNEEVLNTTKIRLYGFAFIFSLLSESFFSADTKMLCARGGMKVNSRKNEYTIAVHFLH